MADEQNPTNQPPAPQAAPVTQPAQSSAHVITPEVQALIDAARNEERVKTQNATWAEARRKYEKQPEAPKQPQSPDQSAAPAAPQAENIEQIIEFEAEMRARGYAPDRMARFRKMFKAEKPDSATNWLNATEAELGITPKPNNAAPTQPPPAPVAAPTQPRAAAPAPSSVVPGDGPDRVINWSNDQLSKFLGENGGNAANPMHWSNRAAAIKVARMVEAEMARMRITPSRR